MRVAVIGLGDIAQKAYLPVITAQNGIELVFCTRDKAALDRLARTYRVAEAYSDLGALLKSGVDAAFVHTATESHVEVAGALLRNGMHVYVDKPLAYSYEESKTLVDLAEASGRILMAGFNRRFSPAYARLYQQPDRWFVIMQKNRTRLPDYARRFIFDDFIHVVDTLRFLAPAPIQDVRISSRHQEGQLYHVSLAMEGNGFSLMGLMNRDSGAVEETLEVMSPGNKWTVRGMDTTIHYRDGDERILNPGSWEPILFRKGFNQIVEHFLTCIRQQSAPLQSAQDALETHALCERIVQELEQSGAAPWHL